MPPAVVFAGDILVYCLYACGEQTDVRVFKRREKVLTPSSYFLCPKLNQLNLLKKIKYL